MVHAYQYTKRRKLHRVYLKCWTETIYINTFHSVFVDTRNFSCAHNKTTINRSDFLCASNAILVMTPACWYLVNCQSSFVYETLFWLLRCTAQAERSLEFALNYVGGAHRLAGVYGLAGARDEGDACGSSSACDVAGACGSAIHRLNS